MDETVTYSVHGFKPVGASVPVAPLKCGKCATVLAVYNSLRIGFLCQFCYKPEQA